MRCADRYLYNYGWLAYSWYNGNGNMTEILLNRGRHYPQSKIDFYSEGGSVVAETEPVDQRLLLQCPSLHILYNVGLSNK